MVVALCVQHFINSKYLLIIINASNGKIKTVFVSNVKVLMNF